LAEEKREERKREYTPPPEYKYYFERVEQEIKGLREGLDIKGPFESLKEKLAELFGKLKEHIADGLRAFWDKVVPAKEVLPKEIYSSLTTTTPSWAKPLVNELTHYYLSQAEAAINSVVESNPYVDTKYQDQVKARLKSYLLPATAAIITGSVAAQLAELIHPIRELRVSETVRNILTALGLYTVVNSVWTTIYNDILVYPLKYELHALTRPFLPPPQIVDTMLFQGGIDEAAWEEYYKKYGWSDYWINAWKIARYRPPSAYLLYRVIENPNIPEEWYTRVLQEHGYKPEDIAIIIQAIKWYSLKDEIYRYRDTLVSYYKKGLINRDRLINELTSLPLTREVINWTVAKADLEAEMEALEDKVNAVREGFRKGKITELEYINQLKAFGIEERRINAWLELDKIKRKVELRSTVVSLQEVG
jgi:hypothetical protein